MTINIKKQIVFFFSLLSLLSCANSYTQEEIDQFFEPITSQYGLTIVYVIDEAFPPIYVGGGGAHAKIQSIKAIKGTILIRYPDILQKALAKYPVHVVKKYLNAIYFAGVLKDMGIKYAGTYDPFRGIIYLINDGSISDQMTLSAFHHEFSSLLLARHGFSLNSWLDNNPEGFKYRYERFKKPEDVYGDISDQGTDADYDNGFMNTYAQTNFENDFNEYAAMIFTYPEKFREIMSKYPRVRAKFLVFLDFYRKIDPVFTEEYLLGKAPRLPTKLVS